MAIPRAGSCYSGAMDSTADRDTLAPLDSEACRRARMARDHRFDGEFFLAVKTTGIYCRPICPARPAAEKNVSYFHSPAQAAAQGYRPCLRCRPESAPSSPAWQGSATTVQRALKLIEDGALNDGRLPELAERLGVGERYLRKLFQRELGISPVAVAQNQRLLFARKLLLESHLAIGQVAEAAGYGSLRRFNSAIKAAFQTTPGDLRARLPDKDRTPMTDGITLRLHYRPPYDWSATLDFLRRHAVEPMESVSGERYQRSGAVAGSPLSFDIGPGPGDSLLLNLRMDEPRQLATAVNRIRQMLDLDAHPVAVAGVLGADPHLGPLVERFPGLRAPRAWSHFEAALRAVVGQQVSVGAARTVLARLLEASGEPYFGPGAIAQLDDSAFSMPSRRRDTVRAVCRLFEDSEHVSAEQLAALAGVGPWTTDLYRLRGLGEVDVMPLGDLGLKQAWEKLDSNCGLEFALERWRPWNAYAANLLWRSLSP